MGLDGGVLPGPGARTRGPAAARSMCSAKAAAAAAAGRGWPRGAAAGGERLRSSSSGGSARPRPGEEVLQGAGQWAPDAGPRVPAGPAGGRGARRRQQPPSSGDHHAGAGGVVRGGQVADESSQPGGRVVEPGGEVAWPDQRPVRGTCLASPAQAGPGQAGDVAASACRPRRALAGRAGSSAAPAGAPADRPGFPHRGHGCRACARRSRREHWPHIAPGRSRPTFAPQRVQAREHSTHRPVSGRRIRLLPAARAFVLSRRPAPDVLAAAAVLAADVSRPGRRSRRSPAASPPVPARQIGGIDRPRTDGVCPRRRPRPAAGPAGRSTGVVSTSNRSFGVHSSAVHNAGQGGELHLAGLLGEQRRHRRRRQLQPGPLGQQPPQLGAGPHLPLGRGHPQFHLILILGSSSGQLAERRRAPPAGRRPR